MNIPTKFLLTAVLTLGLAVSAQAQDGTWTGGAAGNLNNATNWTPDLPGSGGTATFNGQDGSRTSYSAGANVGGTASGWRLHFTEDNISASNFTNTTTTSWDWRLFTGTTANPTIRIDDGAGAVRFGSLTGTNNPFRLRLSTQGTYEFINNSSNTAVIGSNVTIIRTGAINNTINFRGTGSWDILGNIDFQGTGNIGLVGDAAQTSVLRLSGNNSALTPTQFFIMGGTLAFSQANNLPGNDATIRFGHSTGAGRLLYEGSGDTVLSNQIQMGHSVAAPSNAAIIESAGTGTLTFSNATFNNQYDLGKNAVLTLTGSSTGANTISGVIQNAFSTRTLGITKNGDGRWVLEGENTYTGATTINAGTLVAAHNNAFGAGTTTIRGTANTGTLALQGGITLAGPAVQFQGRNDDYQASTGGIRNLSGNNTITVLGAGGGENYAFTSEQDTLTVNYSTPIGAADRTYIFDGAGDITFNGNMGAHTVPGHGVSIYKVGTGTTTLNGANPVFGSVDINSGTLRLTGSMANTSGVNVASGATFAYDVDGFAFFNRNISGAGDVVVRDGVIVNFNGNNTGHSGTLTVDAGAVASIDGPNALGTGDIINNNSLNFWANSTVANNISGSGDVTVGRFGAGTNNVTFSGNNSFAGAMTIGGVDTGDVNVAIEGNHSGGGSITVAADSSLTLADGGSLTFVIGANNVNNSITGAGSIDLDGLFIFDVSGADLTLGNTWTIVASGFAGINYGGTFDILNFTDQGGGIWTSNNPHYQFDMGSGVLSVVPEPATYALIGGLLALGAVLIRRRMK